MPRSSHRLLSTDGQSIRRSDARSRLATKAFGVNVAGSAVHTTVETNPSGRRTCQSTRWHRYDCEETSSSPVTVAACLLAMYFATVVWPTAIPSLSNSPWMRGAPQNGLAKLISQRAGECPLMSLADHREDVICGANRLENQCDASGSPFPECDFQCLQHLGCQAIEAD